MCHLKNLTGHAVYEFNVDHLEEKFQNYHFNASYQVYYCKQQKPILKNSGEKRIDQKTIGCLTKSKDAQGQGLRESKNLGNS